MDKDIRYWQKMAPIVINDAQKPNFKNWLRTQPARIQHIVLELLSRFNQSDKQKIKEQFDETTEQLVGDLAGELFFYYFGEPTVDSSEEGFLKNRESFLKWAPYADISLRSKFAAFDRFFKLIFESNDNTSVVLPSQNAGLIAQLITATIKNSNINDFRSRFAEEIGRLNLDIQEFRSPVSPAGSLADFGLLIGANNSVTSNRVG